MVFEPTIFLEKKLEIQIKPLIGSFKSHFTILKIIESELPSPDFDLAFLAILFMSYKISSSS